MIPRPIDRDLPQAEPLLAQLVKNSRQLMDAAQAAPELFASRFHGRASVDNLVPVQREDGAPVIVSAVRYPHGATGLSVMLVTSSDEPQHWRVDYASWPVAIQALADRAEWSRRPDADKVKPQDGAWMSSPVMDQVRGKPEFGDLCRVLQRALESINAEAQAMVDEINTPDYRSDQTRARNALLGRTSAVAPQGPSLQDVGDLMGRISRQSRIGRP